MICPRYIPFALALVAAGISAPAATIWRFDMGTASSPVAPGFVPIAPESTYSRSKAYGWESAGQTGFDVPRPPEDPRWHGPGSQVIPREFLIYKEHNDTTRDGVSNKSDLVFRTDVPNGTYRVAITLGRLDQPICSEQIYINDQLVARDVDAKHMTRRGSPDQQYGFPRTVRQTVMVTRGLIRIRIHGDDSSFRRRFLAEFNKPAPVSYLTGQPARVQKPAKPDLTLWGMPYRGNQAPGSWIWVWEDIGGPFTRNAVNSIQIYPYVPPPLEWKAGKLAANNATAQTAVALFNAGQFAESEKAFSAVADEYTRALGYLWLAGRPQYENEQTLLPKARDMLNRLASTRPGDLVLAEFVEQARRMDKAIYRFYHRADEQRAYIELEMITGEVSSFQSGDPLYYKGKIYAGRALYIVIPHRWTFASGAGRQMFEVLEKDGYGENRFARWYLHDEWAEHKPDWVFPDYSAKKRGAPRWAADVFEAYNRELDLAEWWISNRQTADGALGGGWGDDVEVLRSFGVFAATSIDASPLTIAGIRKVSDGAWNSGSIDRAAGYFADVGDTEHSGEWTADTLVAMIRTDYGNPVFIERAMKTGKLMRDLWMAENSRGHFLMRSNFLGATGVGGPGTQNDSRINYRLYSRICGQEVR